MMRHLTFNLAATAIVLAAQTPTPNRLGDMTFPSFANGDGRQKLSEFLGQPVAVVGFADVNSGTVGADRAFKLLDQQGMDGLVVVLMHFASGGTFPDAAIGVDLGAWAMRRYPGREVRLCESVKAPTWKWEGTSPFFAVIGPDGALVKSGDFTKGSKEFDAAVQVAMKQFGSGWGSPEEAVARKLMYVKGELAAARSKAPTSLTAEVDAVSARRQKSVEWLLDDGQWIRARRESEALADASKGVDEWTQALTLMADRFADDAGKRELDLDSKLEMALKPLKKNAPDKGLPRKLRELAKTGDGTKVGARASRLATLTEQALSIR